MIAHRPRGTDSPATALRPDQQAWLAALYAANYAVVFRVCSRLLRNPDDAADAAQDVFLTAVDGLEADATAAAARAWLLTVARNHCVDVLRRRARLGKAVVRLGPETAPGTDIEAAVANRDLVAGVMRQLTVRERRALWQAAVERHSVTDIADRMRLTYMAAAQVLHRARRHALAMAAKVAALIAALRFLRERRLQLELQSLAVVAAVPLVVVAIHSSSSLAGAPDAPAALARSGGGLASDAHSTMPTAPGGSSDGAGALMPSARAGIRGLPISIPSSQDTLQTVAGQVGKVVPVVKITPPALPLPQVSPLPAPSLPAVTVSALPTPSLPAVSVSPLPTPSVPALP